jgi:hypothetical protein
MSRITPDQMQALLGYASRQLGMTPDELAKTVQSGGIGSLLGNVSPENARKISALLGNTQQAERFLNSPEVRQALGKLLGGSEQRG